MYKIERVEDPNETETKDLIYLDIFPNFIHISMLYYDINFKLLHILNFCRKMIDLTKKNKPK